MSDYRITVKVRNARILDAIAASGHKLGPTVAKLIGISYYTLVDFVNCKKVPFDVESNLTSNAEKLCIFFHKLPNELWSSKQLEPLITNIVEKDFDETVIGSLLGSQNVVSGVLENMVQKETVAEIEKQIDSLPPKIAEVLRLRFGIGENEHSLQEIAEIKGVTRERIRQIEIKGLRILRHPSRGMSEIAHEVYEHSF